MVESKKETKKLENFKDNQENKEAIAASQGKALESKDESFSVAQKEIKKETKETKEVKVELEREYIIPIRKYVLTVPRYKRAKRAIFVIRKFLARHMKVEEHDIKKVKIDNHLNNEIWFRGIKKPPAKIKVKAVKKMGIVYAELLDIPEVVRFKIEREKRRSKKVVKKSHKHEHDHKHEEKTESEKTDEKEKEKSSVEAGLEKQKKSAKEQKHTAQGKHQEKTTPRRMSLKK